jgi:hypothetical protein
MLDTLAGHNIEGGLKIMLPCSIIERESTGPPLSREKNKSEESYETHS